VYKRIVATWINIFCDNVLIRYVGRIKGKDKEESSHQGNQIWIIFSHRAIVYFGIFLK
jgi:hypothetical protein